MPGKIMRYSDVKICTIKQRNYRVYHADTIRDYEQILPHGTTKTGKRTANLWRTERNYTYQHAKQRDVDRVEICTIPMCFDIETTTIDEKYGYMYHWQFAIGDIIILGRTWSEFDTFLCNLLRCLKVGKDKVRDRQKKKDITIFRELRVWVANLGFEFQFLRFRYKVLSVFAKQLREPLTVLFDNGLFMQDALSITNSSLAKIPKLYNLPTPKMVGDLDYEIIRNSKTPLSQEELKYCINDVKILIEFGDWLNKNYIDNGLEIPYTATGVLRDTVKKDFKKWINDKIGKDKKTGKDKHYLNESKCRWFTSLLPDTYAEFYKMQCWLFRGGYTHGNALHAFEKLYNVNGVDFTSSYPAVMLQKLYPMSKFVPVKINSEDDIYNYNRQGYAVKFKAKFINLDNTTCHAIESLSKTMEYKALGKSSKLCKEMFNYIIDNGRVLHADQMTVYLTDIDMLIYKKFYTWDKVFFADVQIAKYGRLPEYLTDAIIYYYSKKAELKKHGLDGTTEYKIAKAMVNAAYGMMCEHLHILSVSYEDDEWIPETTNINPESLQEDYLKELYGKNPEKVLECKQAPKKFLSMYWGVWVTAHARYNLLNMVYEIGEDCIYCDTDSIYMKNYYKHVDKITKYNYNVYKVNRTWVNAYNKKHGFIESVYKRMCKTDAVKASEYKDKTQGILYESFYDLGEFDKLNKTGNYIFKQGGAKRYIKESRHYDKDSNKWYVEKEQTIAGLPKTAYIEYCEKHGYDYFDEFKEDGFICNICKNAHSYNDKTHTQVIKDMYGISVEMTELSSVGIFPIDFEMKLDEMYMNIVHFEADKHRAFDYRNGDRI